MATTDAIPIIKVLFALHAGMDAMDFVGPLEVLSSAKHNANDDGELSSSIFFNLLHDHLQLFNTPSCPSCPSANLPISYPPTYLP